MAIEFSCNACGKQLKVDEKHVGRKIKCPGCKMTTTVPSAAADKKYLIKTADGSIGPIGFLDVADLVNKATLKPTDLVCIFGNDRWKPVREWPEFMELSRLSSQKTMVVKTRKTIGLILKLAAIVAVIAGFFLGLRWYTDGRIASRASVVYEKLASPTAASVVEAQDLYEQIKADFPEHSRLPEIAERIRQAQDDLKKQETMLFTKKRKEADDIATAIRTMVEGHDFQGALFRIREIRKICLACDKMAVGDNPEYAPKLAELRAMPDALNAEIIAKRREYVMNELRRLDELMIVQEFKEAKAVLVALNKVATGLESDLTDMINRKSAELTRLARGESAAGTGDTVAGGTAAGVSTNIAADLGSDDPATRIKGLQSVITAHARLSTADRDAFREKVPALLEDQALFYPALDAILAVGDDGKLFGRIFDGFTKFILYGKPAPMEKPLRPVKEFVPAVVDYGIKYGGLDKEDFLGGLLGVPDFAAAALDAMGGDLAAADVPNLKNRIEKVIMESSDDKTVTAAIRALGRMKSSESLEMLLLIIDYTTCTKCSLGTGDSGHKYLYQSLLCARCRQGKEYTRDGSIFRTTLEAVRAIGSNKALAVLKKLAERERTGGNTALADQIGSIIDSFKM